MDTKSQVSIIRSLRAVLSIVPGKEKRKFWLLLLLALACAGVEIGIASLVALLAAVFTSTEAVLNNEYFLWLKELSGSTFLDEPRLLGLAVLCLVLVSIILKNLLATYQQWQIAGFSESVAKNAREHLFRFYLRAPFLWVLNTGTTDMLFGLNCCSYLSMTLLTALQTTSNILMLVAMLAGLIAVAPVPALIFIISIGCLGYAVLKLVRRVVDRIAKRTYAADLALYSTQQMAVHGLKEMRMYQRETALFESYQQDMSIVKKMKQLQQTVLRFPVASLEILGFATLIVVLCYLIYVQDAGMARISGIMGFMAAAAWRALPVANRTVESLTSVRTYLPYVDNAAKLIQLEKEMEHELMPPFDRGVRPEVKFTQSIRLEAVNFRYPLAMEDSLQDVSMQIEKGQMVGVVGFSGAGKSTFVNVLAGLLTHDSGDILIDDVILSRNNVSGWLANIGYVAQSPFILDASLAENIALSRWGETIDRERVLTCCEMAALDFVDELEDGLDTVLGERGVRLSGGEAQRVAIARALYSNPELIIFDEATSSLDIKNEQAIHRTVLSLHNQVTMIIIAHRLSTVESCDYLIWLDKGRVKMQGPVNEVLPAYKLALDAESLKADN